MNGQRALLTLKLTAVLAAVATAGVLLWLQLGPHSSTPAEATDTVDISVGNFWFCDSGQSGAGNECVTTIAPGTTVRWNFQSTHTATECGPDWVNAIGCSGALWDSGFQGGGNTYERTFNSTGEFFYLCKLHPFTMFGKVVVSGSPKPTATITPTPPPTNTPAPPTDTPTPPPANTPAPPTDTPTVTPTPTPKDPGGDTDGDTILNGSDPDDDNDGCTDVAELQTAAGSQSTGGLRNPHHFWDFFDPSLDKAVAFTDFLFVLQHFNTNDNGGAATINRNTDPLSAAAETAAGVYSPRYDRGGQAPGGDPWDELAANGSIGFADFLSLLRQFGHNCQ